MHYHIANTNQNKMIEQRNVVSKNVKEQILNNILTHTAGYVAVHCSERAMILRNFSEVKRLNLSTKIASPYN